MKLISTEQVSKYHPDKVADQISDAIVTACLIEDTYSHVAVETLIKGKTVVIAGEITSNAKPDYKQIIYRVLKKLNYYGHYKIIKRIQKQSSEIRIAVNTPENFGAGDQGIMYGYATRETASRLPVAFALANKIISILERDVEENSILLGDAKCQVTVDLDELKKRKERHGSVSVNKCADVILISACHRKDVELKDVKDHIRNLLKKERIEAPFIIINPAGPWTIGGPEADCGVTGRKIVCDQYGGFMPVGGGAFSGKDPTKVDRSASYMARHMAIKALEEWPEVDECKIQLAYAIGKSDPVSVCIETDVEIPEKAKKDFIDKFDLTPKGIIDYLDLTHINYESLSEGCHYRYGEPW